MRIKTAYERNPYFPQCDWSAWDDATYDGEPNQPIGRGRTEEDAIKDLLDQLPEAPG
jgi:hypothetical protein